MKIPDTVSKRIEKIKDFYILGSLDLWTGKKASSLWGRCREICADPSNAYIPRVADAGRIYDDHVVMHNGLKCRMGEFSYYSPFAETVLAMNRRQKNPLFLHFDAQPGASLGLFAVFGKERLSDPGVGGFCFRNLLL